jgi:hypothetical protein
MRKLLFLSIPFLTLIACEESGGQSDPNDSKIETKVIVDSTLTVTSNWETVEISDEFGDMTGVQIQTYEFKGEFSNSATTRSELCGRIRKEADGERASV